MTAVTVPTGRDTGLLTTAAALTARTVRMFVRTPQLIVVSIVQGAMFLLIFRYVFGGAIETGGVPYVDFLVPGYVVTSVLFAGMGTAAGVAEDVQAGVVDRLRSLPVPRIGLVLGRIIADTVLLFGMLAVTVALGFAVGFRIHTDAASAITAFGLCLVFGFAFDWLFLTIGVVAGNAQTAQGMGMIAFPLTFASSAYVPIATMPAWLQAFAEHQPLTPMCDAVRALTLGASPGQSTASLVAESLLWSIALVAVFAPLAVAAYNRR